MQKLHLVGFTADFDGLIFSARKGAKSGSFVVPIDGRLLKQIAEAERLRDGGPVRGDEHRLASPRLVRPESALNPREMQDRIRSGWTVDEVAAEAGVDLDWVRRFAAPVLAEVRRVVERARDAVYDKPRFGLSTLPLGASVRRNVLDRGVRLLDEELDEGWSAYQLDEDLWVVRFAYTSRGRLQEAEWGFDVETEELVSRNRLASQLGHVARGRKRSSASATSSVPKPSAATKKAAARPRPAVPAPRPAVAARNGSAATPVPKKAVPKKAAAKPPARKAVATKAVATKAATRKVATKKATTRKATTKKLATKTVATKATAKAPTATKAAGGTRPSSRPAAPARRAAATNGASAPRRATVVRPATAGRAPSAPRKKAAARPTKKPAKETAAALIEAPERVVPPTRPQDWPTDPGVARWVPPEPEPLPPPGPAAVPDAVREAAATPIGDDLEPPRPGAAEVDPVSGVARIDSRRTSRYVSTPPARSAMFRGDVARAGTPEPPGPRRPRRTEPLRGR